jgi:hypothetical protein
LVKSVLDAFKLLFNLDKSNFPVSTLTAFAKIEENLLTSRAAY